MSKILLTSFTFLSFLTQGALADRIQFVGKYAIDKGACQVADYSQADRVMIDYRYTQVERNLRLPSFAVLAYSATQATDDSLLIGNFEDTTTGADGKQVWTGTFDESGFHSVKHFIRYGSSTWPDLEMKDSVSLVKTAMGLQISKTHEVLSGRRPSKKTETCDLVSLASDAKELKFRPLFATLKDTKLNALKGYKLDKKMDLDQATVDVTALQLSSAAPTVGQIKEMLAVAGLGVFAPFDDIKVRPVVKNQKPTAVANAALATVLKYANEGDRTDYQSLFSFRDELAATIKGAAPSLKIYSVEWSESSNDGEGVLIIDSVNKEALYVGASYHE